MHVCHECKDLRVERDAFRDRALAAERLLSALQWAIEDDASFGGFMVGVKDGYTIEQIAEMFAEHREKIVAAALEAFASSGGHPESVKRSYPMEEKIDE